MMTKKKHELSIMMTMTLQSGSKFDILAMTLMVMMTLLLTSNAFMFQSVPSFMTWHLHNSMKKPSQQGGTTTIASSTKLFTQQLLMSSRKGSAHYDHSWRKRYLELKEYHQKFGHTNVSQRYPDNPQLGRWVMTQRASYKKGKLTAEQIRDLVDIGFQWDPHNAAWEQRYLELKGFSQKSGHTNVPQKYPDNPQLGHWVNIQRKSYKKGKLTDKKIQALVDIGFQWGSDHTRTDWDQRYLELKEFHQKFGHTDVPNRYPDNPQLGRWGGKQRTRYKSGKLADKQIQDLLDIGFQWDSQNAAWEQRYLELKEFSQKFGHTDVPRGYPDNPQLGLWVMAQRANYKKGKLKAERIQDLVDISFQWDSQNAAWEQRYLELKEFRQKVGHTYVPKRYPDNPQLGLWVRTQRANYKKGKLTAEQIQALVDIDFIWEVQRRRTKM